MKAKTEKTIKPTIASRKPWGRLDEQTKTKIVSEVNNGLLSERAAGRKYGLPKSTIGIWRDKHNLAILLSPKTQDGLLAMEESKESKLLKKKIEELTNVSSCYSLSLKTTKWQQKAKTRQITTRFIRKTTKIGEEPVWNEMSCQHKCETRVHVCRNT